MSNPRAAPARTTSHRERGRASIASGSSCISTRPSRRLRSTAARCWTAKSSSIGSIREATGYGLPPPRASLSRRSCLAIPCLSSVPSEDELRTRKTVYEIIDGQQRSQAILEFFNDDFRLSTSSVLSMQGARLTRSSGAVAGSLHQLRHSGGHLSQRRMTRSGRCLGELTRTTPLNNEATRHLQGPFM